MQQNVKTAYSYLICALRVRTTFEALINDSAVPGDASFASVETYIQPLPLSH